MIRHERYSGGRVVAAEIIDLDAGTYSRELGGVEVERRPLTADEIAAHQPPTPTAEDRLDAVRQVLAQVDTLTAPILAIDVADVLAELREVL